MSSQVAGKKYVREVELVEGRGHSVRKGWIVSFNDVDTVEKVSCLMMIINALSCLTSMYRLIFLSHWMKCVSSQGSRLFFISFDIWSSMYYFYF